MAERTEPRTARGPFPRAVLGICCLWAALAGPALLEMLAARPAGAQDLLLLEDAPALRKLTIEGNRAFDRGTIENLMTVRTRGFFQPFRKARLYRGQLDQDVQAIQAYYRARGFISVLVTSRVTRLDDGVEVVVQIDEGRRVVVTATDIRGPLPEDAARLARRLRAKAGSPLSPYDVDADRQMMEEYYSDRGRPFARVEENVQIFGGEATVIYLADPGPTVRIRSIRLTGAEKVHRKALVKEVSLKSGDLFSATRLTESRQRLYDTGLFSDVEVDTADTAPGDSLVGIKFELKSRRQNWFAAGLGYSSENLIRLTGEWGTRNILSSGRRFSLTMKTARELLGQGSRFFKNRDHSEEATFYEPWVLDQRLRGQLSGFYHYDNVRNEFVKQVTYGSTMTLSRVLKERRSVFSLGLEARWVRNRIENDSVRVVSCAEDPLLCRERYKTRIASLHLTFDNRNDFLNPARGSRHEFLLQQAGGILGGDNSYQLAQGTAGIYRRSGKRNVFAARVRLGGIFPPGNLPGDGRASERVERVPFETRFFSGGANTIRGYQENTLNGVANGKDPTGGGLLELVMNAELRYTIVGALGGVLFVDAGNVWRGPDRMRIDQMLPTFDRDRTTPTHMRYSMGGGLRFNTPVGPIRLEGAWRLSPAHGDWPRDLTLALGQAF